MRRAFLLFQIITFLQFHSNGQSQINENEVTIEFEEVTLLEALRILSDHVQIPFIYSDNFLQSAPKISQSFVNTKLSDILHFLLAPLELKAIVKDDKVVIVKEKKQTFRLYGFVISQESKDKLPYASLYNRNLEEGFVTDENGYYSFELLPGQYEFLLSSIGHASKKIEINLERNKNIDFDLIPDAYLPEIVVDESAQELPESHGKKIHYGRLMELSLKTPGVGGASDLLQTAKNLPGIQSGAGGVGGYFVRGGTNDQNLFLLDGVAIYNPFHTFGLTSIFIPQTTKSLQILKSGFHPQYGDRASSVIDIRLKEGNQTKYTFGAGVNSQDAFLKLEGPILKDRLSFLLYGRKSLANFPFDNIVEDTFFPQAGKTEKVDYADLIGKLRYKLDDSNDIFFTFYDGRDDIKAELREDEEEGLSGSIEETEETELFWGNRVATMRWQKLIGSKSLLNTSVSYNSYSSRSSTYVEVKEENSEDDKLEFSSFSSVNRDFEAKIDLDLYSHRNVRFKGGGGFLHKSLMPKISLFTEDSEELQELEDLNRNILDGLEDVQRLSTKKLFQYFDVNLSWRPFELNIGNRLTYFQFDDDDFLDIQPRLRLDVDLGQKQTLSLSAARTVQYIHLLSLSNLSFPSDIWYPSFNELPPLHSWHYNLGLYNHLSEGVKMNLQFYYKKVSQLPFSSIDPILDGVQIDDLYVTQGKSRNMGVEVGIDIAIDSWDALISYSGSIADQTFEAINGGNSFDFPFNRVHEGKAVIARELSDKLTLGLGIYASSGNSILAINDVSIDQGAIPMDVNSFGEKNKRKTGWQHRIDLSLAYTRKVGRFIHDIKLNLYNTYNVEQPLFYTVSTENPTLLEPSFSIPFIPSLSYNIQFR